MLRYSLIVSLGLVVVGGCGGGPATVVSETDGNSGTAAAKDPGATKGIVAPSIEVLESRCSLATAPPLAASFDARGQEAIEHFHRLYFDAYAATFGATRYMGVPVLKVPADLWAYQEILFEVRPDVVIETGTFAGGSALFIAHVLDQIGHGRIITVDYWDDQQAKSAVDQDFPYLANRKDFRPKHPRLTYLHGPSTAEATKAALISMVGDGERGMVILDSDHTKAHVLDEIDFYQRFVAMESYLIVEDTNTNNNPLAWYEDGPFQAVEEFLPLTTAFVADRSREKFLMTLNPMGFLKRVAGP